VTRSGAWHHEGVSVPSHGTRPPASGARLGKGPLQPPVATDGHTVPAGVVFPLLELVSHWDIPPDDLLGPLGLRHKDFVEAHARFPHALYVAIVERARQLTGEPALGFFWGLQMRISAFGYLGYALMTAATLRDAIELAIEFTPLGSTAESMHLHVERGLASLVLDEHADYGSVRDVVAFGRLMGLWRIAEAITGRDLRGVAEVPFAEPAYFRRFAEGLPEVRFEQPKMRMLIDAEILDFPLVMANPVSLGLATEQCTRELHALSSGGRLVRTVRGLLWKEDGGLRTPGEVAAAVAMSPRNLRRKLTLQGTTLSALLDEERRDRALLLLRLPELSLAEVAERLGYGNTPNFERAFRRWTGATPAAYRRS
jgi:AraC-like DNA-binding protein